MPAPSADERPLRSGGRDRGNGGDLPSRTAIGTAQVIGGGLALLTVVGPMMANADSGTRLALAMMHVVLGVAVVLSLEAILRWAKARRAQ